MAQPRLAVRKFLLALAVFTAGCFVVLLVGGEALLGRRIFSDGRRALDSDRWNNAHRFVWAEGLAPTLPPSANSAGDAGPAEDPVRQDLVFSQRVAGSPPHHDLFRMRWTADGYGEPEPLFELNTLSQERDPAFTAGGRRLVFASDREGGLGGFDLWVADVTADGFGPPRPFGPGVNSPEDDRHPTFDQSGLRLAFSSARWSAGGVTLDVFESEAHSGAWTEPRLVPLSDAEAGIENRSPSYSSDGRFLIFASDRPDGAGGYDLYRVARHRDSWLPAEALTELNTPEDEDDPAWSAEGSRLHFTRTVPESHRLQTVLQSAHLREVLVIDEGEDSLWSRLLAILGSLLFAILLTYLATHWQGLHPFVKFVILSLLVHVLVLLYLHAQRQKAMESFGSGGERAFVVSMMASADSADAEAATASQGDQVTAEPPTAWSAAELNGENTVQPAPAPAADAASAQSLAAPRDSSTDLADAPAAPSRSERSADAARPTVAEVRQPAGEAGAVRTGSDTAPAEAVTAPQGTAVAQAASAASSSSAPSASSSVTAPAPNPRTASGATTVAAPRDMTSDLTGVPAALAGATRQSAAQPVASLASEALAREGSPRSGSEAPVTTSVAGAQGLPTPAVAAAATVGSRGGLPAMTPPVGQSTVQRPGNSTALRESSATEASVSAPTGRPQRSPSPRRPVTLGGTGSAAESPTAVADASPGTSAPRGPAGPQSLDERPALAAGRESLHPPRSSSGGSAAPAPRGPTALLTARDGAVPAATEGRSDLHPSGRSGARSFSPPVALARGAREGSESPVAVGPARPLFAGVSGPVELTAAPLRTQSFAAGRGPSSVSAADPSRPTGAAADFLTPRSATLTQQAPVLADALSQRRGPAREIALQKGGGSAETEAAVLAGLRYLRSIQNRDGSFGQRARHEKYDDFRYGKTGLALLAFLGSGYTQTEPGEFQDCVQRGLGFLIGAQDRRSGHIGRCSSYGHGISTYALAEAFAMTQDPELRVPLLRAVGRITAAQVTSSNPKKNGGWSYYYADTERTFDNWPRMSVSVWQIMALKSARVGGIPVKDDVFTAAEQFIRRSYDPELAAFRYDHDPDWLSNSYPTLPGTTPAALFAWQLLGGDRDAPEYAAGLEYIQQRPPMNRWRSYSDREFAVQGLGNLYYLYYGTLALFFHGGDRWVAWNQRLTSVLVRNQSPDGSWKPISYYARFCGDTDEDRAYTTAMCVLMLEVYYRYFTPLLTSMEKK